MSEPSVPAVVMMDAEEARHETMAAKGDVIRGFERLAAIREREGWKALDYETWDAYLRAEWGWNRNYANKQIDHGKYVAEIEAAAGTSVPGLTERSTRSARSQRRAETVEQVADRVPLVPAEEVPAAVAEIVKGTAATPGPEPQKRTRNFDPHQLTLNLTDDTDTDLKDIAVATNDLSGSLAGKLFRAVVKVAKLAVEAGVTDPARFIEHDLAAFVETGEVVNRPKANGKRRQPQRDPAPSNGECPKHVASKPGLSGLVVCTLCGLPRNKWETATNTAGAGPKVERQSVEVQTAFKGGGKK